MSSFDKEHKPKQEMYCVDTITAPTRRIVMPERGGDPALPRVVFARFKGRSIGVEQQSWHT
jgi:hypothetical protein